MTSQHTVPRLHVLTGPNGGRDVLRTIEAALAAGAPGVQVRVKGATDRDHLAFASAVVERCCAAEATCIVNDRVDLALASGADGVHLGATDLPVRAARELAGDRLLIGGTAREPDAAARLVAEGADYLGCGPLYTTTTKDGLPDPIGFDTLAAIVRTVDVPVIGISGITAERIGEVLASGAHGVAVTAAITSAADPAQATRVLLAELEGAAPVLPAMTSTRSSGTATGPTGAQVEP
jgi:thiamine-phosphate pyrophosphorylase